VNGLSAFFAGEEIQGLIDGSIISHILPVSAATLTLLVGFHDTLMFLLINFMRKYQRYLFAWSMIWIVIVMSLVGEPFDILEHVGIFVIAFALWLEAKK
jgi:hypothetical protein